MKIIISGYGRMGKEIQKAATSAGHVILLTIDTQEEWKPLYENKVQADVVIDFSLPEVAVENMLHCFKLGLPVVTGTTGWYDKFNEIEQACKEQNGTLFYAPNFSLGVNLFFRINKELAKMMAAFPDYRISMQEIHHVHKLDAPSGTAIKAAEDILQVNPNLEGWVLKDEPEATKIPIASSREGEVPGTHKVRYESSADLIELKHEAKNRSGFAHGAMLAADWVKDRKGVFNMDDLLKSML